MKLCAGFFPPSKSIRRPLTAAVLMLSLFFADHTALSQTFTDVTPDEFRTAPNDGIAKWGDMNNDGKLELVYTGSAGYAKVVLQILAEEDGVFKVVFSTNDFGGTRPIEHYNMDLGDYDADGDLDIVVTGGDHPHRFNVVRNDGNYNFFKTSFNHSPMKGSVCFGDVNNDGSPDILYSGYDGNYNTFNGVIFGNKSEFEHRISLFNKYVPFQSWADFDSDGDLDIIQSRVSSFSYGTFLGNYLLFQRDDGTWEEKLLSGMSPQLYGTEYTDYDGDGTLDVLIRRSYNTYALYRLENKFLTLVPTSFPKATSAKWADFNNDGYPDILFTGGEEGYQNFVTRIYYNDKAGGFADSGIRELPSFSAAAASVGDFDSDGDVDIALTGDAGRIFRNNWIENQNIANDKPDTPVLQSETTTFHTVTLHWSQSSDAETPAAGLTYNLRVRRDDGTLILPDHISVSGDLMLHQPGNMLLVEEYKLGCLQEGSYVWTAQAVDHSNNVSSFAPDRAFSIANVKPQPPTDLRAQAVSDLAIRLEWTDNASTETEYRVFRKAIPDTYGLGYYPIDTLPANTESVVDNYHLQPQTSYDYRVVAYNCSYPDQYYMEAEGRTFPRPFVPSSLIPFESEEPNGQKALLADYDNDKDLDLLLSYAYDYPNYGSKTSLFKNENGRYFDTGVELPYLDYQSSAQWIDYNRDGYMDLFLVVGSSFSYEVKLFLNDKIGGLAYYDPSLFFDFSTLWQGGISFADFDNDADLDMLVQGGNQSFENSIQLLVNDGNNHFTNADIVFEADLIVKSTNPWGDFNNDGYLDLLVSRKVDCAQYKMKVLKNLSGKAFEEMDAGTSHGLNHDLLNYTGEAAWGDYDNDGFLDFVIAGQNSCGNGEGISHIYHNEGNERFTRLEAPGVVPENHDVNAEWADFDNDGFYDLLMYGDPFGAYSQITRLYKYDGGTFVNSGISYFPESTQHGNLAVGDIDNDTDLDFVIMGRRNYTTPLIHVELNNHANAWGRRNTPPAAPSKLQAVVGGNQLTLNWDPAGDLETAAEGLTYNIYLIHDSDTLIMPNSHKDGYRKLVQEGNVQHNISITLNNLAAGEYTWGVQAIDKAFAGGPFSVGKTVTIAAPPPVTGVEDEITPFFFFPNPVVEGVLRVKVARPSRVALYNLQGQKVLEKDLAGDDVLSMETLPAGLYLIKAKSGEQVFTGKVINANTGH